MGGGCWEEGGGAVEGVFWAVGLLLGVGLAEARRAQRWGSRRGVEGAEFFFLA